ncbi:MAG TPA: superoxide dismutase [Steroidobacteraceae bacterium]|jgi:Fe-Mn family superoxide dismutase|nr:superoxide dismutase [Steroidobacteraceae bacterium]
MSAVAPLLSCLSLPPLTYAQDALEPIISAQTVALHYGGHHRDHIEALNRLTSGTVLAGLTLESLIHACVGIPERAEILDNAAQAWNHAFYWQSLTPRGGGLPPLALRLKIETCFGSVEACKKQLVHCALSQSGSGWAWLVIQDNALKVMRTANAETPITQGLHPLLAIDIWEHAYYLDYQNRRLDYVSGVIDKLVDWDAANYLFRRSPGWRS